MAQPGNFTPILLYGSSTPTNVPSAANLTNSATGSEIAINVADKNLFFKDSGGAVNTVPIRQSNTSSNGWLSATDWNTFNNKAPATSGTSILYGNGLGGFSNVTIGSGISFAGGTLSATGTGGTVTSVAATVPSFLSVSGSPITSAGTLAITLSGTALPVANGGTGSTTATGSGSVVLATSPTISSPTISGTGITFPNGSNPQAAPAKILQVVTVSTQTTTSTSANSMTAATGLSASITPLFSTSKVLVIVNVSTYVSNAAGSGGVGLAIYRNGSSISSDPGGYGSLYTNLSSTSPRNRLPYVWEDSPATTSSTTYALYFSAWNGNTSSVNDAGQYSTITLMEIAQ